MLRIQRAANGKIVFSLSGRIASMVRIVLNLRELVLVDGEAVEFLAGCEAAGMTLRDCPAYVRTWIDRGREENK